MTKSLFPEKLLLWNSTQNSRQMPWKGEKDAYKIWLSEIILQQTRVDQGLDYYNRFINTYPTISHLAQAPDEQVFKLWEGLGYYTRCRNLLTTARYIHSELDGKFPSDYTAILKLKGIGSYTAAAISSFAFGLPYAVVDGNVQRILSRYFAISTPIDSAEGRKFYQMLANSMLDKQQPAIYNQAIMDFGATICKPQQPLCRECIMANECEAFRHDLVKQLPVKEKKLVKKHRYLHYFIIENKKGVFIRKRTSKDIWQNLHEFVLIESSQEITDPAKQLDSLLGTGYTVKREVHGFRQLLTHQVIHGKFFHVSVDEGIKIEGYDIVSRTEIGSVAFPRLINQYLQKELA